MAPGSTSTTLAREFIALVTLVLVVAGCRGGEEARRSFGKPQPPIPVDAVDAGDADASARLATRPDVTFHPPWVVLGQNLVDARTARRARTLAFGETVLSADGPRFALGVPAPLHHAFAARAKERRCSWTEDGRTSHVRRRRAWRGSERGARSSPAATASSA